MAGCLRGHKALTDVVAICIDYRMEVEHYAQHQEYIRDKSVQPRILACIRTFF